MELDVIIETPDWEAHGLEALCLDVCAMTLRYLDLDPQRYEFCVLGCDDAKIAELNADFRGKPTPTNVLSWPSDEIDLPLGKSPALPDADPDGPPYELGDIAIAFETCWREAAEQGKPFEHHLTHLLIHATLHLLGFDHINDPDAAHMEAIEARILESRGIPDPY